MTAPRGLDDDSNRSGWSAPGGSIGHARLLASYRRLTDSLGKSAGLSRFYLDSVEEAAAVLGTDRALLCRYDSNEPNYIRVVAGTGPLARLEGAVLPTRGSFEGSVLGRDVTSVPSLEAPPEYFRTAEHRRYIGPVMAIGLGIRGEPSGVLLVARAPGIGPFPEEYGATLSEVASLVSSGIAIAEHFDAARGGRGAVDAWREERYARQWLDSYREIFASRGEAAFRLAPSGSIEWGTTATLVLGVSIPPPDTMTALLARLESDERIMTQSALRRISSDGGGAALSVACTVEVAPGRKRPCRLSIWKDGDTGSFLGVIAEAAPSPVGSVTPSAQVEDPNPAGSDPSAPTALAPVSSRGERVDEVREAQSATNGVEADRTTDPGVDVNPGFVVEEQTQPGILPWRVSGRVNEHGTEEAGRIQPAGPTPAPALDGESDGTIGADSDVATPSGAGAEPAEAGAENAGSTIEGAPSFVVEAGPGQNGTAAKRVPAPDGAANLAGAGSASKEGSSATAAAVAVVELEAPAPPEGESESLVLTDFHCHLVPGVDDGAVDEAESTAALERVYAAGVRHLIVTPHLRLSVLHAGEPNMLALGFERLASIAREKFPDLKISRGAEVMLDDLDVNIASPSARLAGTRFVLVEFTGFWIPPRSPEILGRMIEAGFVPVVAHPERYANGSAREATAWREAGARLQVNCGSLLGQYGPAVRNRAWQLLSTGGVDYMASDYHARGVYPVEACVRLLEGSGGKAQADLLLKVNPSRLARGEDPLPVEAVNRPTSFLRRLARGRLFR